MALTYKAAAACHWFGVDYAAGDPIDTTGYGPEDIVRLVKHVPVYVVDIAGAPRWLWGTYIGLEFSDDLYPAPLNVDPTGTGIGANCLDTDPAGAILYAANEAAPKGLYLAPAGGRPFQWRLVTLPGLAGGSQVLQVRWIQGSLWVATTNDPDAFLYTSLDGGETWTLQTTPWDGDAGPHADQIRWDGANILIMGGRAGQYEFLYSPDGVVWTAVTSPFDSSLGGIATDGTTWVFVGRDNADPHVVATAPSTDPETWTTMSTPFDGGTAGPVYWDGELFYVCGDSYSLMTSPDLETWTDKGSSFVVENSIIAMASDGDVLLAVSTQCVQASYDQGASWFVTVYLYNGFNGQSVDSNVNAHIEPGRIPARLVGDAPF